MNIDNITSDNMTISSDGKSMQIAIYEKEINRLNKAINKIKEVVDDYFGYDYENESQARLDTINEINHIIVELKGDDNE